VGDEAGVARQHVRERGPGDLGDEHVARRNARQAQADVRFLHADITSVGSNDLGSAYSLLVDVGCLHGLPGTALEHAAATITAAARRKSASRPGGSTG